jgi:hypothetical protein
MQLTRTRFKQLVDNLRRDGDFRVVNEVARKPNVCVQVQVQFEKKTYTGTGFSKVCQPDEWDYEVGKTIARAKAVIHALEQIISGL